MREIIKDLAKEIVHTWHGARFSHCPKSREFFLLIMKEDAMQILKELEEEKLHGFDLRKNENGVLFESDFVNLNRFVVGPNGVLYELEKEIWHYEDFKAVDPGKYTVIAR